MITSTIDHRYADTLIVAINTLTNTTAKIIKIDLDKAEVLLEGDILLKLEIRNADSAMPDLFNYYEVENWQFSDSINLIEWSGKYDKAENDTQLRYLSNDTWYDWFCKDKSLLGKTRKLGKVVKFMTKLLGDEAKEYYVIFKNNCPIRGKLYDDIRIWRYDETKFFVVTPKCGHNGKAKFTVGNMNKESITTEADTYKELKNIIIDYFKSAK